MPAAWGFGASGFERCRTGFGAVKKCIPGIDYSADEGCVVANEISTDRAGMLVHQIARQGQGRVRERRGLKGWQNSFPETRDGQGLQPSDH